MNMIGFPQSVEQLLQKMVGYNSVNAASSGNTMAESELGRYLATVANTYGCAITFLPVEGGSDNVLVTHTVDAGHPWLLFESHMDTVSVEGMTIRPLEGEIVDGKLYGRGACDAKGSGAAMLWALYQYAQTTNRFNNVAILFSVDEESGMTGIRSFIKKDLDTMSFRPWGVIVGEPTMMRPIIAHNGVVRWCLRSRGISAHACDPSKGRSAIAMMVKAYQTIDTQYARLLNAEHPMTGKAQCSINVLRGGEYVGIVPNKCEMHIDRRVVPGEDIQTIVNDVARILHSLKEDDDGLDIDSEIMFVCPPLNPTVNEAFLSFVQYVLRQHNLPIEPAGAAYGTHAGDLSQVLPPVIVLGPGNITQAHTKDEWIAVNQLHVAARIYQMLMTRPIPPTNVKPDRKRCQDDVLR